MKGKNKDQLICVADLNPGDLFIDMQTCDMYMKISLGSPLTRINPGPDDIYVVNMSAPDYYVTRYKETTMVRKVETGVIRILSKSKPKFNIGDKVVNKVERRGSHEPSTCALHNVLIIDKVERRGDSFQYTCGYDGYEFMEEELMSLKEYKESL